MKYFYALLFIIKVVFFHMTLCVSCVAFYLPLSCRLSVILLKWKGWAIICEIKTKSSEKQNKWHTHKKNRLGNPALRKFEILAFLCYVTFQKYMLLSSKKSCLILRQPIFFRGDDMLLAALHHAQFVSVFNGHVQSCSCSGIYLIFVSLCHKPEVLFDFLYVWFKTKKMNIYRNVKSLLQ